jgi:hypothetical protein
VIGDGSVTTGVGVAKGCACGGSPTSSLDATDWLGQGITSREQLPDFESAARRAIWMVVRPFDGQTDVLARIVVVAPGPQVGARRSHHGRIEDED